MAKRRLLYWLEDRFPLVYQISCNFNSITQKISTNDFQPSAVILEALDISGRLWLSVLYQLLA